jgi:four helix bundle protein
MQDFRKLRVWHSAKDFCVAVYRETETFPRDERYGLTSQLRRAARSIPANIAEGSAYLGLNDSARFYQIGLGSGSECLSDMLISAELGFLRREQFDRLEQLLRPTTGQLIRLIQTTRRSAARR